MAGESFWELKAQLGEAIRCDHRLSPFARCVGLELLTWLKEPGNRPLFDRATKNRVLRERLGFSDITIRLAKKELADYGHFRFQRTGRADLAWVIGARADRSLQYDDQIVESSQGGSSGPDDQIVEIAPGRSLPPDDRKSRKIKTRKTAEKLSPQGALNEGTGKSGGAPGRAPWGNRCEDAARARVRFEAEISPAEDGGNGDSETVPSIARSRSAR